MQPNRRTVVREIFYRVVCYCGSIGHPHALGCKCCFRELVPREQEPKPLDAEMNKWILPGGYIISNYTLKMQRLYFYHEKPGRWSKPKSKETRGV